MRASRFLPAAPLAVAAITLAASLSGHAQARRPMTLLDLISIPRVGDVQLSPDGRFVVYNLGRADWKADGLVRHLWRQAVAGGPPIQLTNGDGSEVFGRWSPDSRTICYFFRGQLFLVPADGGEAKPLTHHSTSLVPTGPGQNDVNLQWAPDGSAVYFVARDPAAAGRGRAGVLSTFEATDFEQQHIWKVSVANGAEQQVTSGDWSVIAYRLSRDGKHLTLRRSPTPLTNDHYRSDIWVMDLDTGRLDQVTRNEIYENEAELSPDHTQVCFVANANRDLDAYYGPSLFVVSATGGKPRLVSPGFKGTIDQAAWSPDGKSILAVANMGVHSEVFRFDLVTGIAKALTDGQHAVQGWSVVPSANRMVFQFDEPTRLGDGWTVGIDGGAAVRVTGVYDSLDRDFAMPRQEKVSWKGGDGTTIEGLLFYPVDYRPGTRVPLLVQLHGGPDSSDRFGYGPGVIFNYVPVLAAKGYAVFRPNYRGSAGYGPDFFRDIVNHYFNNMHLDVMAGVDFLIKEGIVDPNRLAVSGWSAGGTLVNKLITFTDRFKAASSGAGVADWISMMAQTDALTRRTFWFGGTPWDANADLRLFLDQSPIRDVAKVKTPTLFFAGDKDTRVPLAQSQEMYRGLEHNGVPTKLIIGPGQSHDWTPGSLRQQLEKDNVELAWFEQYVNQRSYQPEPPPADSRLVK